MNSQLSGRLLIVASICYGITIAFLGYLGSSALTTVAVAGALVLGALWAIRGVFTDRQPRSGGNNQGGQPPSP